MQPNKCSDRSWQSETTEHPIESHLNMKEVFSQRGDTWSVSEDITTNLEAFFAVYMKLRMKDVNIVCFMKTDENL